MAALVLGFGVRSASVAPDCECVLLERLAGSDLDVPTLRRAALVCAAGPAADLRFDSRGWRGYRLTDARNDLAKVGRIAVTSECVRGHPLDVADVLREADRLVWKYRAFVAEAASALARFETLEGPLLAQLAPRFGAGLAMLPLGQETRSHRRAWEE